MQRYDLQSIYLGITEHSNIVPKNLVEIGSRDGHDSKVIAQAFHLPDESCYLFEANPAAAQFILQTYPNMHLYNNLVSDKTGSMLFNVEPENIGASSVYQRVNPCEGMKTVEVEAVRMDEFIESENIQSIDVCKLDVEGASLQVLESFGKHIDKLQSIQIELEHEEIWKGQSLYPQVSEWLIGHGFTMIMFTLLRKVQSDSFWLKNDRMLL